MSLLNDALKAAEQRQDRHAPSPYTGQGMAASARRGNIGKVLAGIVLLVILAAGAYYLYLYWATPATTTAAGQTEPVSVVPDAGNNQSASSSAEETTETSAAEPEETVQQPIEEQEIGEVIDTPADRDQGAADIVMQSSREPEAEPAMEQPEVTTAAAPAPEPASAGTTENTAASEGAEPQPAPRGPQPPAQTASSTGNEPQPPAEPETTQTSKTPPAEQATTDANIKQARQSPEQRDRDASKAIRTQVSNGELAAAEATLTRLTDTQTAPKSRYAFARAVLARGDVDGALEWVPENLAARYPDLRLIRARALLAGGDLDQAVATLRSGVPPVADNVEYRVTLATLLQQQGQSDQAANHWAELIAMDDSRAPWWVGLAIALEGRGDVPAARRAYQQAAALPGLAPSLADYVRQRLQILGAG
ncbi:tetratricopeptide repeat protein [Marinobacter zhanjiangensis]|uniref:MSHA biogenesis protein MshN n=1 Tax=Marinobacter zhanjiangensis TaxID=578215 RepID=A0ABQ3BA87_9GAMM|nr:tetratricopeptide repeat protein [Marinobacter zhanjiangensis]GGY80924.1 hypothetical protein GCM10007071_30360 [Marinobacter zhanjiangensis]